MLIYNAIKDDESVGLPMMTSHVIYDK